MRPWVVGSGESTRFPVWTRANVGEVFPDPVGPLSFRLVMWDGAELGWRDAWEKIGAFDHAEFNPEDFEVIGIFGGYCYLNASVWRVFGERTPGLSAEMIDGLFFGSQPGIPPYELMDGDVSERHSGQIAESAGPRCTRSHLGVDLVAHAVVARRQLEVPEDPVPEEVGIGLGRAQQDADPVDRDVLRVLRGRVSRRRAVQLGDERPAEAPQLAHKLDEPGDDLLTLITRAEIDGEPVSPNSSRWATSSS